MVGLTLVGGWAAGDSAPAWAGPPPLTPAETPRVTRDLIDPAASSRFEVATRSLIGDAQSLPGEGSAHMLELSAYFEVAPTLAITARAPVAYVSSGLVGSDEGVIGNLSGGLLKSGHSRVSEDTEAYLRFAGGLDIYLPTAPGDKGPSEAPSLLAALRAGAPQNYLPSFLAARGRFHLGYLEGPLMLSSELHLTQGFFTGDSAPAITILTGIGQFAYDASDSVSLSLRASASRQIIGDGTVAPPVQITPGVRFMTSRNSALGVFCSLNFEQATAVIIGLDFGVVVFPDQTRPGDLGDELRL